MNGTMPHIVQYQGSKRKLAPQILRYMPYKFKRCIEPFAGSAAITIAVAAIKDVDEFIVNDLNAPLIGMLREAVENPDRLYEAYQHVWDEQFTMDSTEHFLQVREAFNAGAETPENMLYLLARCVKGSVRYNNEGKINQSCDKRRHGTKPETVYKNMLAVSGLLRGRTEFYSRDYREIFEMAEQGDIVYMDPPYQGTSTNRDSRYLAGLSYEEFAESLKVLNDKQVDYLISYDGNCGGKSYGQDLPEELGLTKLLLNAGRSTQATLLGRDDVTYEALYVSAGLKRFVDSMPMQESLWEEAG